MQRGGDMTDLMSLKRVDVLRQAAVRASQAPSVHNTQPWRFVLHSDALEVYADASRQLRVLDPSRRQLLISCGCALFNARVSLAAAGYDAVVERFPDPDRPDFVARLSLTAETTDWLPIAQLDDAIERRQSNRRRYSDDEVSPEVLADLGRAAAEEDSQLFEISAAEHRLVAARLSQQADATQNGDPAYRAELRAWTSDDPRRRDGVQAMAVPYVDAGSEDDLPVRDFDTHGMGWLPTATHSCVDQCLLLLGTREDVPGGWLRAGEALERLWLVATGHDYVISLLTQVIEIPATRELLRSELSLSMHPHVLLRIGRAPVTPASRRRSLEDVVVATPGS
jgi:nitroreductase